MKEATVYKILAGVFGASSLAILMKVFMDHPSERVVGERFVISELILPTPIYVFHFKPITLFTAFGFLWWVLGMEGFKEEIKRVFPKQLRKLVFVALIFSAFIMGYEALHNFLLWMSFYIIYQGNLDLLYHQVNPAMPKPVNFNFISKLFSLFFAGALYGAYFFHKLIEEEQAKGETKR